MPRYFHKVGSGFNVAPALAELKRLGAKGSDDGVDVVPLYQHPAIAGVGVQNSRYAEAHSLLGEAVEALGSPAVYSAVLRVLPAKSRIPKHQDRLTVGSPKRYHLAVYADDQSRFFIRDERCRFASGELWHVDILNRPHYVVNDSDHERVMLMVDVFQGTEGGVPLDPSVVRDIRSRLQQSLGPDWERMLQLASRDFFD